MNHNTSIMPSYCSIPPTGRALLSTAPLMLMQPYSHNAVGQVLGAASFLHAHRHSHAHLGAWKEGLSQHVVNACCNHATASLAAALLNCKRLLPCKGLAGSAVFDVARATGTVWWVAAGIGARLCAPRCFTMPSCTEEERKSHNNIAHHTLPSTNSSSFPATKQIWHSSVPAATSASTL